ncbi:hypothetical protein [Pseudactinotalea terrae]|uniref:hypothetical protein n=1 Tax=Pseudactinotalea terrae TaxID=1743262 RepID=UPI0012E1CD06|nr:hypothetical protein [Pseudactinotalea terrae]
MNTPVRVTAQTMGATVFNTKNATLEWTPDGRIRIVEVEPGQQPAVLLDTPPPGLRQVSNHTVNQSMLVFKPQAGPTIKLSLLGSMIAPEPNESADSYARRTAMSGVPPQSWWVQTLRASGVKVVDWGWGKSFAIAGGIVGAVIVISLLVAALSGAF